MANTAQAKKRARQAEKRRQHNVSQRSSVRTAVKKVLLHLESGNKESAAAALQVAVPLLDNMARKGIIHKNLAARHKSRLNQRVRASA